MSFSELVIGQLQLPSIQSSDWSKLFSLTDEWQNDNLIAQYAPYDFSRIFRHMIFPISYQHMMVSSGSTHLFQPIHFLGTPLPPLQLKCILFRIGIQLVNGFLLNVALISCFHCWIFPIWKQISKLEMVMMNEMQNSWKDDCPVQWTLGNTTAIWI